MKQVSVLGVGLLASLALAWSVYTDTSEVRDDGDVAMFAAANDSLESVSWADDDGTVRIEQKTDAKGDYFWVTITEEVAIAVPAPMPAIDEDADGDADSDATVDADSEADSDVDTDTQAVPEVPTETVTRSFKGNSQARELWDNFSPLYALRDLSEGASTAAFGLDDPKATLTVDISGQPTVFNVGGETFGAKDRYVGTADRVFLVDDSSLRPLQYAKTRLVERTVQPFESPSIVQVEVNADGRRAVWTHENRDDRGADYYALQGTPDEAVETTKSWMRKLLAVRAQAYLDEATLDVEMVPVFSYTVSGVDASFTVDVFREVTEDDDPRWFARPEYNRSLVELTRSLATDAFVDVDVVLP